MLSSALLQSSVIEDWRRANYLCFGLSPPWFHLTNILLHATASAQFMKVCLRVAFLRPPFAVLAGLLFAVHPIHTEAVTGIVGRADVLACVFFLISLLAYHGHTDGLCHIWLSIAAGGISMLAKETGVTVLLINLIYDVYLQWHCIKRSIIEAKWNTASRMLVNRASKIITSLGVFLALRLAILQGSLPKFSEQDNPAAFHSSTYVRFLTFCHLAGFNLWLTLYPATLSHDWQLGSVPLVTTATDPRCLCTWCLLAVVVLLAAKGIADFENQKHAPIVLGVLLLVVPFLPASNLLITVGFVVAERVLYIPSLGCVLLVIYGAQILWQQYPKQRQSLLCCIVLVLMTGSMRTVIRNRDWYSRETLLRSGLKTLPHNAKMHYNYANFLRDTSKHELAKTHYYTALKLWPSYASAHNNLGTILNDDADAERHFLAAIKYSAKHVNAHYNLGQLYRRTNRTKEAEQMLRACVRLEPRFAPAYVELARMRNHRDTQVPRLLRKVVSLNPTDPYYAAKFGNWLDNRGNHKAALKFYWDSLRISSTYQEATIGVLRILRKFGQKTKLFQMITRWHVILNAQRGRLKSNPNIYLQEWRLKNELRGKLKMYDVGFTFENLDAEYNALRFAGDQDSNRWSKLIKNKTSNGLKQESRFKREAEHPSTYRSYHTVKRDNEYVKFAILSLC